jgi:hypothetical protein
VAARYFNNNLERALILLKQTGYISKQRCLSVSRFNRQLHRYRDLLDFCLETLLELSRNGEALVLDSMPVPVCHRKRADAVAKSEVGFSVATVPPKMRSSLAGACIWSVRQQAYRSISLSCRLRYMI